MPDPGSDLGAQRLKRVRRFARLLDTQFGLPGTKFRFGFDGLVGLIPGVGDFLTNCLSFLIVFEAIRMGASRGACIQMVVNILIDLLVGAIPVLGDVFDFAFKSNQRNLQILEDDLRRSYDESANGAD